jgi:hypothetical protein
MSYGESETAGFPTKHFALWIVAAVLDPERATKQATSNAIRRRVYWGARGINVVFGKAEFETIAVDSYGNAM